MSYQVVKKPGAGLVLEQGVLGSDGATLHPVTAIPQGFELEAMAQSGTRSLYMLRQAKQDSALLLLTDSLGRTLQQARQYLPRMSGEAKKLAPPRLFGLPGGKGFILTYTSGKSSRPVLQVLALSPALQLLWQQQFAPEYLTAVQQIVASDTHLWLVLKDYLALAPRPHIVSFRLATGDAEGNIPLAPNDALDAVTAVPAGLLILGVSDRKTSYTPPVEPLKTTGYRRDFALLLSPTGQRTFGVGMGWPSPGPPPHCRWQSAFPLPDGGYQLLGETYRNIPDAGTIALGVLGAGMLGVAGHGVMPLSGYSNERPVGLVLAHLSLTGQLTAVRELAVPEILQATNSAALNDPYSSASPSSFRFRGFSSNYQEVILNTSRQVLAYSLATQQLRPLTPARNAMPTVLAIEPARITISWSVKTADTDSEFEQIAVP